jgi:hypothetical protein
MKKTWIILMFLLALMAGCKQAILVSPPEQPPGEPPEGPPLGLAGPVLAALYDGITVRLWDGQNAVDWKTGAAAPANGHRVAVNQVLYTLAEDGSVVYSVNLPAQPVGVIKVNPVYTFENITNAEAYAIDWTPPATGGNYTRIWKDGVELGDWHNNGFTHVQSFLAANGDVIVVDNVSSGHFHNVTRGLNSTYILWAVPSGPIFYMPDPGRPTEIAVYDVLHPDGIAVTLSGTAGAWGFQPWIEVNGVWYNGYGATWDGATFRTGATALKVFLTVPPWDWQVQHGFQWPQASEAPVMIPAYVEGANLYFIETTTGSLWSYSPQTDTISYIMAQLYLGDGKTLTGEAKAKTLKPEYVEGSLYYHEAGTLWRRDSVSAMISAFSVDQQMWVMK